MVLYNMKGNMESGDYCYFPPRVPCGQKILLEEVTRRICDYHEPTGLSPGDQSRFPLDCSITDIGLW